MATNGGIIGKSNKASFGKCTVTTKTSSGNITTQSGTRVIESLVIAGGGSGGNDSGGGGGAGGMLSTSSTNVCGSTAYAAVIGAGSANPGSPQSGGVKGIDSTLTIGSTVLTAVGGGLGAFPADGGPGGSGGGKVIVANDSDAPITFKVSTAGTVVLTNQYCDAKSFKLITGLNNGATTLTVMSTPHGTAAQSGEIVYLTLVT